MNSIDAEKELKRIFETPHFQKIEKFIKQSDEREKLYNEIYLPHIKQYFIDDRNLITSFNLYEELTKEITEFTFYSERTYAAVIYDFAREILKDSYNRNNAVDCIDHNNDYENFKKADKYFTAIAEKTNPKWEGTVDVFDSFALQELEEFIEVGFGLIDTPTLKTLIGLDEPDNRRAEFEYVMCVGLFLLCISWMGYYLN